MFAVCARRTMAGARPKLAEPVRRNNVIDMAKRWQEKQAQIRAEEEAKAAAEEARRARVNARIEAERQRLMAMGKHRTADPRDLIGMVAAWHGVTADEIVGPGKPSNIMAARHDAVVAVYTNCRFQGGRYSLKQIGKVFHRDHTSILHSLKKAGIR